MLSSLPYPTLPYPTLPKIEKPLLFRACLPLEEGEFCRIAAQFGLKLNSKNKSHLNLGLSVSKSKTESDQNLTFQESLCTPTGQGRGATYQLRLTPPKREMEEFFPFLLICGCDVPACGATPVHVCGVSWHNICLKSPLTDCLNALTPFVTFPNDCISSYMTAIMTDNDPTINWTVKNS